MSDYFVPKHTLMHT